MKYVVTGGAGFIGSQITKLLVEKGHDVSVIDNLNRGNDENLQGILDSVNLLKMDILDYNNILNELKNVDGVFHQAALTSVPESYQKEKEYRQVNIGGTENIFKIAKEFGFKVVFASSSSVYGNSEHIPIFENFKKKPISLYGITKLEDEKLAEKYSKMGTKIIGLRYFNVYGKNQNPNYAGVITIFFENIRNGKPHVINGDGSQIRDFVHVDDVARVNLAAMESKVEFGFFNIGTGVGTSISKLTEIMIRLSDKQSTIEHAKLPEGDVRVSQADISLAKKSLLWEPQIDLEEGLSKLFFNRTNL